MAESAVLTTSAMGKDHQTASTLPERLNRYAAGTSATNWRHKEVMEE